jgi:hypothetical protein
MWAYFTYEKERLARKRIADQTKGIGKPKVGGAFQLVDQEGNAFTSDDMLGKYSLVRRIFFSNCNSREKAHANSIYHRFILASRIAPIFARTSSTRWPSCTIK